MKKPKKEKKVEITNEDPWSGLNEWSLKETLKRQEEFKKTLSDLKKGPIIRPETRRNGFLFAFGLTALFFFLLYLLG